jgi:hypothetical protein
MNSTANNCAQHKGSSISDNDNYSHSTMTTNTLLHQVVVIGDFIFIYISSPIYMALLLVSALCDDSLCSTAICNMDSAYVVNHVQAALCTLTRNFACSIELAYSCCDYLEQN